MMAAPAVLGLAALLALLAGGQPAAGGGLAESAFLAGLAAEDGGVLAPLRPLARELEALTCTGLLALYASAAPSGQPLQRHLTPEQERAFTLDGLAELGDFFVDDSNAGQGTHYRLSRDDIDSRVAASRRVLAAASLRSQRMRPNIRWLYEAVRGFGGLEGLHVLVFGSMTADDEALALAAGARHVTTVEYNRLTYDHPDLTTATPATLVVPEGGFDVALSISSFDHDGLGRYGDPLQADGDLRAMRVARCLLKPGGTLFLNVPVGPDVVAYNLHRRYGRARLPLFLGGWAVEAAYGWDDARLDAAADFRHSHEPVLVLRPRSAPTGPKTEL